MVLLLEIKDLRLKISTVMHRRDASVLSKPLPPRVEVVLELAMNEHQIGLYNQVNKDTMVMFSLYYYEDEDEDEEKK